MFPFTLQLLGIILDFFCFVLCSCFAAAVGNRRFLSLLKQLSEATEKILISCGFVRFRWNFYTIKLYQLFSVCMP